MEMNKVLSVGTGIATGSDDGASTGQLVKASAIAVPLILLAVCAPYLQDAVVMSWLGYHQMFSSGPLAQTLGTFLAGGAAYLLYRVREENRMMYGLIEIYLAAMLSVFAFGMKSPLASCAAVIGSLYVFIRGYHDFARGRKERAGRRMG